MVDVLLKLVLDNLGVSVELYPHDPADHHHIHEEQDPALAKPRLGAVFFAEDQAVLALIGDILVAAVVVVHVTVVGKDEGCLLYCEISGCSRRVVDVLVGVQAGQQQHGQEVECVCGG